MRQVLFYIPVHADSPLGLPGWVVLLMTWAVFCGYSLRRVWKEGNGLTDEFRSTLFFCGMVAAGLIFLGSGIFTSDPNPDGSPGPFPIQRLPVFGYGAALVAGVVGSMWVGGRRAKLVGVEPQFARDLTVMLVLAGVIGSRLFHIVQYSDRVFDRCVSPFDYVKAAVMLPDGGLTLYGGLILASLTYIAVCRFKGVNAVKFADAAVPAVFVGIAFGRLGCFLNGCCYGGRCELPWAVQFPQGSAAWSALVSRGYLPEDALHTMSLHPTQIYSTMNAVVLALLTAAYYRYRKGDGSVVALAMIMYPLSRFGLEIIRWDESGQLGTGLTISQLVSLGVAGVGLVLAWWSWTRAEPQLPSKTSAAAR